MGNLELKNLSSIGFSPKDETVLKALTDLLGARTRETWVYSSPEYADVVLLDTDNPEAVVCWRNDGHGERCTTIAYSTSAPDLPLNRRLNKPLRAADLIAILNSLPERSQPDLSNSKATVGTSSESIATPSLAQRVSNCTHGYLKVGNGNDTLILNRSDSTCVISGSSVNLLNLFAHSDENLIVETGAEVCNEVPSNAEWRNARPMLWWIGLHGSSGRLLDHLDPSSNFKIVRWPPPSLIKSSQHYFNLCALLSRKTGVTMGDIQSLTGMDSREISAFLNAASLFGVLKTRISSAEPVAANPVKEPANKSLFEKIRSRLKT